jgi:DNA-binding transcriptional LysR family regulator
VTWRNGKFHQGAQINNVTQSAVSQQISSLERQFKSLLIERSKKKFRLTREGQVLYEYSKQVIQTYDSLQNRLQEIKDIISGTIRVATIYSIGLHDLPPYLKKFLKSFPTVNVHVEYRRANQVYEDVLSNVVDLGLVAYPIARPQDRDGAVAQGHAGADLPSATSAGQKQVGQTVRNWPARNSSASSRTFPPAKPSTKCSRTTTSRCRR